MEVETAFFLVGYLITLFFALMLALSCKLTQALTLFVTVGALLLLVKKVMESS